jgi:hypothetical protein
MPTGKPAGIIGPTTPPLVKSNKVVAALLRNALKRARNEFDLRARIGGIASMLEHDGIFESELTSDPSPTHVIIATLIGSAIGGSIAFVCFVMLPLWFSQ